MISILESIVEIFGFIPEYILDAAETLINLVIAAISAIFVLATSLIELPPVPSPPEFIEAINWFFPIGPVIAVMVPVVTGYTLFLLIRWVYSKTGNL